MRFDNSFCYILANRLLNELTSHFGSLLITNLTRLKYAAHGSLSW